MLNKMIIQGNFIATPELKQTQSGKSVISFRLAWSETYKETKTELYINCVAWGYTAEFISKYFVKGSQIIIEGRLISRSYEDETGNKKYVIELIADNCHFCGYRNTQNHTEINQEGTVKRQTKHDDYKQQLNQEYTQDKFNEDGDLPF